ncbi:protein-disulfide reductase DsbD [Psychrobium sp. nBUS_13]|uniref:protein-disulfide reductase DsbD n=1 Tax=Psychrobium sp. nBUS_13 TaxID=3395319 RepID=UPI003EBC7A64
MIKRLLLASTLLLLTFTAQIGQAATGFSDLFSQGPKFLPQEQAFIFSFSQQQDRVIIRWRITDGYYLYKEKFELTSPTSAISDIQLPKGEAHYDEYFGEQEVYRDEVEFSFSVADKSKDHEITLAYQGCADAGLCYPPSKISLFFDPSFISTQTLEAPASNELLAPVSEQDMFASWISDKTLFWSLFAFFGLGIGLAFTPCVFPMYPILSGIIVGAGKQISTKQAFMLSFVYVQGMALTYSVLGLVVASLGLQFQALFQHPVVLGSLAVLFTFLAASMFGFVNLQLPSSWTEKLNDASNKQQGGKFFSVFMMGVISGLVASPCTTAPLSGVLIYVAQSGDLLLGGVTLYALSLGMGIPLLVMGASGGKLLPKAGAWMDVVKGAFGFMLLSVVVVLLGRFIDELWANMAWSALGISFATYLLHHNQFTNASVGKSIRLVIALLVLFGSLLWGVKPWLMPISGPSSAINTQAHSTDFIQVKGYDELQAQLAIAKAAGKPVMLDFYADWCIACKDFESKTFSDPVIKATLDNMVLIQTDVTANDALDIDIQDKMTILGLPTIILFDKDGTPLNSNRVVGFQGPEQFKKTLDLVNY